MDTWLKSKNALKNCIPTWILVHGSDNQQKIKGMVTKFGDKFRQCWSSEIIQFYDDALMHNPDSPLEFVLAESQRNQIGMESGRWICESIFIQIRYTSRVWNWARRCVWPRWSAWASVLTELVRLPCSQVWFSGIRNLFKISEMGHLYKDCYPLSPGITELDIHTKRCYYQKLQI